MSVPSGSICLPLPHSGGSVFCLYFVLCPPRHAVVCVRLFIWVMSPTCPLGSQVSGLRKAVSESHRDYWEFRGSPWFWGWWEVRTFPMEAINFHIWVAIHLNQIISDQKDVLWWALNLSLLPTADLLLDIQHNCSFWPFCPHGTYPCSTLAGPALPLPPRGKWAAILAAPQKQTLVVCARGDAGLFVTGTIICGYDLHLDSCIHCLMAR